MPRPREPELVAAVRRADFVGADACAACHAREFRAWRQSTHGRAGGAPDSATRIAAFDERPIRFRNATVTPRRARSGRYEFLIARSEADTSVIVVDGVIGGGHMEGGGTQGFLTRRMDGTYRFLPFDYSRQQRVWFCNTNSRVERGWVPITAELPLEACGDWPPVRVLGDVARFANCQACHASQLEVAFDTSAHRYETRFTTLAINCESCHGPGRRHVELARSGRIFASADIGMAALATFDKDRSLVVCFQCHAVKDQLRPGYLPGDALERYYSLAFPLLGDRPLAPDGRVRTFAYQESHRYSDCYLNGGMRCTDCHDPHAQSYRDVDGTPLPGRFDDRQCTSCHASKADSVAIAAHTRHPAASPGSRCVACHMPYVQHPEIGSAIRYARADHSISIPRSPFEEAGAAAPACLSCHRNIRADSLQAQAVRWFGTLKPRSRIVAAQLTAERRPEAVSGEQLLGDEGPGESHQIARFAGLASLLDRYLAGEGWLIDDGTVERLQVLASKDRPVDTRALALATLHLVHGDEWRTRRLLAAALSGEGERDGALRDRWALALGYAGDRYTGMGRLDEAVIAYQRALEIRPQAATVLTSLANAERDAGRLLEAIRDYQRSLTLDARQPLTLVNMGVAQAAYGDTSSAMESWTRANRLDPSEPLALFNLGNTHLVRGRFTDAIAAYRGAAERDESLTAAHVNLARAYAASGRYVEALRALRIALRFDTANVEAQSLAAQLSGGMRPRPGSR